MEPSKDKINSTYSFFYNNLAITGFYEENALFMTVKELLDNSIDALTNLGRNKGDRETSKAERKNEIEIEIKEHNKDLSFYEIICRDNGEGIEIKDLEKFAEMFLTSKDNCVTSGKFGIGLKTILLYSFKTAYGFLHIKAKVTEHTIWDFMLVMDKSLTHTFVQNFKELIDENWKWSVEISVVIKVENKYVPDERILYYIKLVLLWKNQISIRYICGDTELVFESIENDINKNVFDLIFQEGNSMIFQKEHIESYNFVVHIDVNVRKSDKIKTHILNESNILNTSNNLNVGIAFLFRYANGMPLFGSNKECSIYNDFKNFLKFQGLHFGIEPFSFLENSCGDLVEELINIDYFKDIQKICDFFYLKKSEKSSWNLIAIGIDITGTDISFSNLNKNCIKEGVYMSNLINKCLLNCFTNVKKSFPEEFESSGDFHLRQALDIYGSQLAVSLSKIILKGRDEFKNKVFYLLKEKKKQLVCDTKKNNTYKNEQANELVDNSYLKNPNEQELAEELYSHIKEKILSLHNEKGNIVKTKNDSSDKSLTPHFEEDESLDEENDEELIK